MWSCLASLREYPRNTDDQIAVRLIQERDVKGVIELLSTEEFWREAEGFPHDFEKRLTNKAREVKEKGFDKYTNTLVAATPEKAVARLIMDTNYPPYSELAGLKVHPDYRGRGIGTKLVRRFVDLAREHGCNILYVITIKDDVRLHRFYSKLGFVPAMIHDFEEKEKEIVMVKFLGGTIQHEFVRKHPLAGMAISGLPVEFRGQLLYEMMWKDPLTGYHLACYLKGRRHLTMPRIAGISIQEGGIAFDAWIKEESNRVNLDREGGFQIYLINSSPEPLTLEASWILPHGAHLRDAPSSKTIYLKGKGETCLTPCLKLGHDFNVPELSFRTVVVTCTLKASGLPAPLLLSAGFQKNS